MDKNNIIWELNVFESQISTYEQMLRTRFIGLKWNKSVEYQFVDNETTKIKNKVRELLKVRWNTVEDFKIINLLTKANDLVRKYETLKDKWIEINTDVIFLYWQLSKILNDKHCNNKK